MAGQQQLFDALQAFAATLAGDYDVSDVLHQVCDHLVDVLGATGAGVTVLDQERRLRFAAATNAAVIAVERIQEEGSPRWPRPTSCGPTPPPRSSG